MKVNNIELSALREEVLVIPRGEHKIVFRARAVNNRELFDERYPIPKPPSVLERGDTEYKPNYKDEGYIKKMTERGRLYSDWLAVNSLMATDGLEWTNINPEDPESCGAWTDELKEAGFTIIEINLLFDLVTTANGLNADKIKQATDDFLASQRARVGSQS